MGISRIILYAVLTAAGWMAFSFSSREFVRMRVPRANVVRGIPETVNGHSVVIASPTTAEMARADLSLPFMTAEAFAHEMDATGDGARGTPGWPYFLVSLQQCLGPAWAKVGF